VVNGPAITIVDTGETNRIKLGQQLRIINKFSPRVIGVDFFLVPDSAGVDSILVKEFAIAKNTVFAVALHDPLDETAMWNSLEASNSKFRAKARGFVNFTKEDSVIQLKLPMLQFYRGKHIYAFSYKVAERSFGVKEKYRHNEVEEFSLPVTNFKNYTLITSEQLFSGKFDPKDLTDKIVLMGYIGKKEDLLRVESSPDKVNGVEIHAAIINELIQDH
jgi:CHASE2 domain-containing sensor protein